MVSLKYVNSRKPFDSTDKPCDKIKVDADVKNHPFKFVCSQFIVPILVFAYSSYSMGVFDNRILWAQLLLHNQI